jgi:hypothetical protein
VSWERGAYQVVTVGCVLCAHTQGILILSTTNWMHTYPVPLTPFLQPLRPVAITDATRAGWRDHPTRRAIRARSGQWRAGWPSSPLRSDGWCSQSWRASLTGMYGRCRGFLPPRKEPICLSEGPASAHGVGREKAAKTTRTVAM